MEIHQSSLNSIPRKFNRQQTEVKPSLQKNELLGLQQTGNISGQKHYDNAADPNTPDEIENKLKQAKNKSLSIVPVEINRNPKLNLNTIQAINAYIIESNQPEKDHLNNLVSGIDIFV